MCGVCLVGSLSPFADSISNSPLFVGMSFVLFSHSIVNFLASLIKASYYYVTQESRSPAGIKESSLESKIDHYFPKRTIK